MKKIALVFILSIVFSATVRPDDGDIHTGGKSCPPGQNCLFELPAEKDPPAENPLTAELLKIWKYFFE